MSLLRPLLALLAAPLPGELRSRLLGFVGWQVDPSAEIGLSWVSVRRLRMGPRSRIGSLSVIDHVDEVTLAERARLGSRTRVRGSESAAGSLRMGVAASVADGHHRGVYAGGGRIRRRRQCHSRDPEGRA